MRWIKSEPIRAELIFRGIRTTSIVPQVLVTKLYPSIIHLFHSKLDRRSKLKICFLIQLLKCTKPNYIIIHYTVNNY